MSDPAVTALRTKLDRVAEHERLAESGLLTGLMRRLAGPWGRQRELPVAPPESFRDSYRRTHGRA